MPHQLHYPLPPPKSGIGERTETMEGKPEITDRYFDNPDAGEVVCPQLRLLLEGLGRPALL